VCGSKSMNYISVCVCEDLVLFASLFLLVYLSQTHKKNVGSPGEEDTEQQI